LDDATAIRLPWEEGDLPLRSFFMKRCFDQPGVARRAPLRGLSFALLVAATLLPAEVVFRGVVVDAVTEDPIPGASVFVGIDAGLVETGNDGRFTMTLAEAGTFDVRAFRDGYQLAFLQGIEMRDGEENTLEIPLIPLGSAVSTVRDPTAPRETITEGIGAVEGRITDLDSEQALGGVTVELRRGPIYSSTTAPEDIERTTTTANGRYRFEDVPADYYTLRFERDGYRTVTIEDIAVQPDEMAEWSVPLGLLPTPEEGGDVFELEEFVVSGEKITQAQFDFQVLRQQSVSLSDMISAEDFSRFAASDVGAVIKRIPGVTVQEGKFAVIRGLSERYSNTLLNGVAVPSPDPDRQSIPLDLFPSEIVSNLVVRKAFLPSLPGNSSGGSIDILTTTFPDEFEVKLGVGVGRNSTADEAYFDDGGRPLVPLDLSREVLGTNVNEIAAFDAVKANILAPVRTDSPLVQDYSIEIGGTTELLDRNVGYRGLYAESWNATSDIGFEHRRYARRGLVEIVDLEIFPGFSIPVAVAAPSDLALGVLGGNLGRYEYVSSSKEHARDILLNLQVSLDRSDRQKIYANFFSTKFQTDYATLRETEDPLPGETAREVENLGGNLGDFFNGLLSADFELYKQLGLYETNIANEVRELDVYQLVGDHSFRLFNREMQVDWAGSRAFTSQIEYFSLAASGVRLPDGTYNSGSFTDYNGFESKLSWRETDESQSAGRLDVEVPVFDASGVRLALDFGGAIEKTTRSVGQEFFNITLTQFNTPVAVGLFDGAVPTIQDAVQGTPESFDILSRSPRSATLSETEREINASYVNATIEIGEKLEVRFGARFEDLLMTTENVEFSVEGSLNADLLQSDPSLTPRQNAFINSHILGYDRPFGSGFRGEIDETEVLPAFGAIYKFTDRSRLLLSYSETIALPSFRELTYVTTRNPVTLEYVSGNPRLTLSELKNFDVRYEHFFGESSQDLFAFSAFDKEIANPIEKTILGAEFVTEVFFNNPNTAKVRGIELEFKKSLEFLKLPGAEYFSVGGNFTYIDASVRVPERFQAAFDEGLQIDVNDDGNLVEFAGGFYDVGEIPDVEPPEKRDPQAVRRLFDQPEWILNANLTFDHQEWGTSATLSFFAQSDLLETASSVQNLGEAFVAIPSRFRDSVNDLTLVVNQRIGDYLTLSIRGSNLLDPKNGVFYDEEFVDGAKIHERRWRSGRSFKVSLSATF
jgi:outer membrane receptor protein involved in Fe transport